MNEKGKALRWTLLVLIALAVTIPYVWVVFHYDWHTLTQGNKAGARWMGILLTLMIPLCVSVCAAVILGLVRRSAFFLGQVGLCGANGLLAFLGAFGGLLILPILFCFVFPGIGSISYYANGKASRKKNERYSSWWGVAFGVAMPVVAERREWWFLTSLALLTIASLIQLYYASQQSRRESATDQLKETTT